MSEYAFKKGKEYGREEAISEFLKSLQRIHDGLFQAFGEGDYLHYIEEEQMMWRRELK